VNHSSPGIQVNDVDRERHPDGMDALRGNDPESLSEGEVLGFPAQQSFHSGPRCVGTFDLVCQNGLSAAIKELVQHYALSTGWVANPSDAADA